MIGINFRFKNDVVEMEPAAVSLPGLISSVPVKGNALVSLTEAGSLALFNGGSFSGYTLLSMVVLSLLKPVGASCKTNIIFECNRQFSI